MKAIIPVLLLLSFQVSAQVDTSNMLSPYRLQTSKAFKAHWDSLRVNHYRVTRSGRVVLETDTAALKEVWPRPRTAPHANAMDADSLHIRRVKGAFFRFHERDTVTRGSAETIIGRPLTVPLDSSIVYSLWIKSICNGNEGDGEIQVTVRNNGGTMEVKHIQQVVTYHTDAIPGASWTVAIRFNKAVVLVYGQDMQTIHWSLAKKRTY